MSFSKSWETVNFDSVSFSKQTLKGKKNKSLQSAEGQSLTSERDC